jgi:hypothetical protein
VILISKYRALAKEQLVGYLLFCVPLKHFSLIWRRYHYRWRAAKFRPMLGAQGLWAGRDLYRATPAATRDLVFSGLIRRTPHLVASWLTTHDGMWRIYSYQDPHWSPFSRLLRHTMGCRGPILTRILTDSEGAVRVVSSIALVAYYLSKPIYRGFPSQVNIM